VTRPLPRGPVVVEMSIFSRELESFEAVEAVTGGDVIESSRGVSQSQVWINLAACCFAINYLSNVKIDKFAETQNPSK
jgi:hypothetical protein